MDNKNTQTYLLSPYLLFSLCINVAFIVDALILYTLEAVASFTKIIVVSFLLIILAYFIYRKHHTTKINVNYKALLVSLCAFTGIIIYRIFYLLPIVETINPIAMLLLIFIFLVSFALTFVKNYSKFSYAVEFFIAPLLALTIIKFALMLLAYFLITFGCTDYNPNRYEFIKQHYFSVQEIASFPKEIPSGASNIKLNYFNFRDSKSLSLQFVLKNGETKLYEYSSDE